MVSMPNNNNLLEIFLLLLFTLKTLYNSKNHGKISANYIFFFKSYSKSEILIVGFNAGNHIPVRRWTLNGIEMSKSGKKRNRE